jgi:hypothetical protein
VSGAAERRSQGLKPFKFEANDGTVETVPYKHLVIFTHSLKSSALGSSCHS